MAVIGAILGDIAGSQFEFDRPDSLDYKHCELFTNKCSFTDDTVMTLAVKKAILDQEDFTKVMQEVGQPYPYSGYGGRFYDWMYSSNPKPYNSFGNGSAMRVSFVGEYFEELEDVIYWAEKSAEVTHNHPEGIKGAVVTAVCIWMTKNGKPKEDIFKYVLEQYPAGDYEYNITVPLDELEKIYRWNETCMESVAAAMRCFYESTSYESFLRNVFRLKCDSDTLAAIGGAVAEEYYGWTGFYNEDEILKKYLDKTLYELVKR